MLPAKCCVLGCVHSLCTTQITLEQGHQPPSAASLLIIPTAGAAVAASAGLPSGPTDRTVESWTTWWPWALGICIHGNRKATFGDAAVTPQTTHTARWQSAASTRTADMLGYARRRQCLHLHTPFTTTFECQPRDTPTNHSPPGPQCQPCVPAGGAR